MDLEAEYNNRQKVIGHEVIIASWIKEAAAFRATQASAELDLVYGPTPRQRLDLFRPKEDGHPFMAMFVHGGYWQGLDKSFASHLASGLLANGMTVAIPSYELCPAVSLADIVEELQQAVAFLYRRHGKPILASGHSAGGHLAAMLLATDWVSRGLPATVVRAALPISGLFDLSPLVSTSLNRALKLDEAEARRLSPIGLPPPNLPIHAFVGGDEGHEFIRQSREIAEAWGGRWGLVAGANHFTIVAELADPQSAMVRAALALLA